MGDRNKDRKRINMEKQILQVIGQMKSAIDRNCLLGNILYL